MERLGERNYALLSQGIKITGSYKEGYFFAEEQLYMDEAETIYNFLCWVEEDKDNRCFGSGNYEQRFKEYLQTLKKKKNTSTKQ